MSVNANFQSEDWTNEIFPAMARNETLEELDISFSSGLDRDEVGEALMDLI